MSEPTRTIAAFDFDGTLSSRDNFVRFLRLVAGNAETAKALAATTPQLIAARSNPELRDAAKETVLRKAMRGRDVEYLRHLGARFARLVVERHLNPEVVARLDAHRRAGHDLVIVSASLTLYLEPAAARLGIPTVLATEMAVGSDGRLTGEIVGENVRGPEKARRVDAWLTTRIGDAPAQVWAYGDSHGDAELLARLDHPVLVGRRGRIPSDAPPVAAPDADESGSVGLTRPN